VLVAAGTYSPSTNSEVFPIEMASGIHLIGSGEDVSIIDAQQTSRVITMEECDNNIISDLTITGGLADSYGGGMNLHTSDPILTNVTISNNTANWGGGMHLSNSNPILTHVTISNNQALQGGGMRLVSSDPILTNVTISNNTASESGGMRLFNSNPILTHVTISNNTAEYYGGGMWLDYSDPILTHVTISNNTAEYYGGGMRLSNSDPILTNVTIANNTANNGGGGMYLNYSDPIMTNSIIWDNSPQSIYTSSGTPLITYSDIEGGWEGEGNIDADPLFCDAENGDLTVQSDSPVLGAGQDGTDMGAYDVGCEPDDVCSACNIYYTDGYPGFCCDMAWDEGGLTCLYVETEWGLDCGGCNCFGDSAFCEEQGLMMCSDYSCAESLSQCPPECDLGDVNCDGEINVLDVVLMVNMILADEYDEIADINEDGVLNVLDVVILVNLILDGEPVCEGVEDTDGNCYETIQIGDQLWMAENLKVTHYNDGSEIPTGYSNSEWGWLDMGAYTVYDDDPVNSEIYGNLYNYYAVDDSRGICPPNYHIPTDDEWYVILEYLGGDSGENWIIAGGKMKDVGTIEDGDGMWYAPNEGANNESDFTAIPAGFRLNNGQYYESGYYSIYWSSTAEYYSDAFFMWYLLHDDSRLYRGLFDSQTGLSIRCLSN